jgi:hypothetical protein
VELVEVDEVGAEAAQAVFHGLAHVFGFGALAPLVHRHAELGCHHHLGPAAPQRLAQVLLALALAVDVRRVEEVDPRGESGVDHLRRAGGVQAHAEVVAAEPHLGDFQRSDPSCPHL